VQLSCLKLVSRLLEHTVMPVNVHVCKSQVTEGYPLSKICHICSFYMACWKCAVSSCAKGFIPRLSEFVFCNFDKKCADKSETYVLFF